MGQAAPHPQLQPHPHPKPEPKPNPKPKPIPNPNPTQVVVAKLGTEMTLASKAAEARLEREKGELAARHARATQAREI